MATEKRLIYANALKEQIANEIHTYWTNGTGGYYLAEDVIQDIDNATTVDAVEVVHGHWIETEEGTICSECNKHPFEDGEFAIANYNGNYCPNCGAKMDGGNEDG